MERREFFSALIRPIQKEEESKTLLRPPYFIDEADFEKCSKCDEKKCIEACEENIILIKDGKPSLNFSESGCSFCDACAEACEAGVLNIEAKRLLPKLTIDMLGCLAWQKTICSMCKDVCLDNAIVFTGLFNPEINDECTGCGFCVGVCPTNAIKIGEEK